MSKTNVHLKFSIVIPVYGRRDLAIQAIESVLNQKDIKGEDIEIVITDDEDDPKLQIKNKAFYKKISKKIIYSTNKFKEGPGGNRQTGLGLTKGKYIVFLDSDDQLDPDFLHKMADFMDNNKFVASLCLSKSIYEKGFGIIEQIKLIPLTIIRDVSLWFAVSFNKNKLYPGSFYLCQFSHMMFNRKSIKHQKFNYDYRRGAEDWDFFVQSLTKGSIGILPQKLLLFRYAPGSSTVDPINRVKKWKSYLLLADRLPGRFKRGVFYKLLLLYINLFGRKYLNS